MITNPGLENHIHRATDMPLLQHTTHRRHTPILALPCLDSTLPRSATCSPCLPRLSFFLSSRRIYHLMPTHVRHPPLTHVLFLRFRVFFSFRVILYASCLPSFFLPLAVSACSCASLCLCSSPAVSYYYYCALYPIACPVRNVYVAAWTCSLFVCLLLFSRFFFL